MTNVFGEYEDLEFRYANGKISYRYVIDSNGFSVETTYNGNEDILMHRNSFGSTAIATYDNQYREVSYKLF